MKNSSFRSDLPWGKALERVFGRMYPKDVKHTDGLEGDFTLPRRNNELLELKSESYSTTDPDSEENVEFRRAMKIPDPPDGREWEPSQNIAVERWSSESERKPGGPWQAQKHGVKWYAHFFAGDGKVFVYRTDDLVAFMDKELKKPNRFHEFRRSNRGYTTMGYVVPRAAVSRLEIHGGLGRPRPARTPPSP